jgi:hypothetical protein
MDWKNAVMSGPKYTATMHLPRGGIQQWNDYLEGNLPVPKNIYRDSPVAMAYAAFEDGTRVMGGVLKCADDITDERPCCMFFWVFDKDGKQYANWPIDISDAEEFDSSYGFTLQEDAVNEDDAEYLLVLKETNEKM